MAGKRRDKGTGTIYEKDGNWHGQVNVAPRGAKRKRRSVSGATKAEVVRKIATVQREADAGVRETTSPTLGPWIETWIERRNLKPSTARGYNSLLKHHILPTIGGVKLDTLSPDHVRALHDAMNDRSTTTVRNAHRLVGAALKQALLEGRVARNVFSIVESPDAADSERTALGMEDLDRLLDAVSKESDAARWHAALLLGMRQGEVLGLTWDNVNLEKKTLEIVWQLQRINWRHAAGCECDPSLAAHKCPTRVLDIKPSLRIKQLNVNLCLLPPKTKGSRRVLPIPEEMVKSLVRMKKAHDKARRRANYNDFGLVFCRESGQPLDNRSDYKRWHKMLANIGVAPLPLHSARHTAATDLLRRRIDPAIIRQILGHSVMETTMRYQHVDVSMARNALNRRQT